MFRVTRYPIISKTESGRVGYRKKYWVAGRVRVPAGHWSPGIQEECTIWSNLMQTNDFFVFWKIFELKFHFTFEFPRSSQSYVVEESIGGQEWRIHAPCSDPRGSISPSSCRESKLDSLHFLKATSNWPTNHHQLCHHLEYVLGKAR